jgi:uncharacterized membrane protein
MSKGRLEAFSDGVLAIIITIMVLEMEAPEGKEWKDLVSIIPTFIGYIISYTYVGIYWVNHHRLLVDVNQINGKTLWANLLWMFFVSLVPFATAWASNTGYACVPVFLYGAILFLSALSYQVLYVTIQCAQGQQESLLNVMIGDKRNLVTLICYGATMPLAYIYVPAAYVIYIVVAALWIMPEMGEKTPKFPEKP